MAVPRCALALVFAVGHCAAVAKDQHNEVHGPLYPIAEPDLLTVIEDAVSDAVADGTMARRIDEARERARGYIDAPPAVPGIRRAVFSAQRNFDPSVILERPVVDASGAVIHAAGTRVNPLDTARLSGRIVLLDANDPWQVSFVIGLGNDTRTRAVLVSGSPRRFEAESGMRAYFDQGGAISRRLGITEVPAVVTQEGLALRIATFAPEETDGNSQ